jgi:hypothetical protein
VKEYFLGVALEGKLWAVTEFQKKAKRRDSILTFQNWKTGDWPISAKGIDEKYSGFLKDDDGEYKPFSLSEDEAQKIAKDRSTIFERKVGLYLKGQMDDFEQRLSTSREKNGLVQSEIEKVTQRLTNKDFSGSYIFKNPNGSSVVLFDHKGPLYEENEDRNPLPNWYDILIVQGKNPRKFIEPEHENENELPIFVAVEVLYQYLHYLNDRLENNEITTKKAVIKDLPALEDAIKELEKLPELWKMLSMMEKPFVDSAGQILGGKNARKQREVMALAQLITKWGKVGYGQFDLYAMLCKRIGLEESNRPDKITNRPDYDNIRLEILANTGGLLK